MPATLSPSPPLPSACPRPGLPCSDPISRFVWNYPKTLSPLFRVITLIFCLSMYATIPAKGH
ncbi:unnamed protein product [Periconia digitata]|uniref:Uncharacterized protein n=1 Tax=Periconia digitata TaxID=1303443 RepID=A0A9W4UE88_9PLEO|nr:unnamed protein product [Periconia digitata]